MNKTELNLYKIILAAYFHDIGKLLWRGGFKRYRNELDVSHAEIMLEIFNNGKEFINKNKQTGIDNLIYIEHKKNDIWTDIAYISALHHSKDKGKYNEVFNYKNFNKEEIEIYKKMISIVYVSDNVASLDRIKKDNDKNNENINVKNTGLGNIFENLFIKNKENLKNIYHFNSEIIENIDISKKDLYNKENFKKLAKDFYIDFINIINENINVFNKEEIEIKRFIYNIDMLLQRYLTLVPSDAYTGKTEDISLYDHTKIVVALSSILYNKAFINEEKVNLTITTKDFQDKKINIIIGDFSGIQDYIEQGLKINSKLAKKLRARSMLVQLLNEAIIEYILDKINLTRANILMNSGGKFLIICDIGNKEKIKNIKNEINTYLIQNFNNKIKFPLGIYERKIKNIFTDCIDKKKNDKENKFILENIQDLFETFGNDKKKVYEKENLNLLFTHNEVKKGDSLCDYCENNYARKNNDINNEKTICNICKEEEYIGTNLVKNDNCFLKYKENDNFTFQLLFEDKINNKINKNNLIKILFNSWNYKKSNGYLSIGKSINNYVPIDEKTKEVKDFETIILENKLKNNSNKETHNYLCLLKGDIDFMSIILNYGFEYEYLEENEKEETKIYNFYSINRIIQFSRFLEIFFGTYLERKIKEHQEFKDIYTVYSGGDDFVFILPFSIRESFVNFLYKEFENFIRNKNIHFSIGLGIFKEKTPFRTMFEETEELLSKAKEKQKQELFDFKEKAITSKGICYYDNNLAFIKKEEKINILKEIQKWGEGKYNNENKDDYYGNNDIEIINTKYKNLESSIFYMLYTELTKIRNYYKLDNPDFVEVNLITSRILYSIKNRINKMQKNKDSYIILDNILIDVKNIGISISETKEKKIEKINSILIGIIDFLYNKRYYS